MVEAGGVRDNVDPEYCRVERTFESEGSTSLQCVPHAVQSNPVQTSGHRMFHKEPSPHDPFTDELEMMDHEPPQYWRPFYVCSWSSHETRASRMKHRIQMGKTWDATILDGMVRGILPHCENSARPANVDATRAALSNTCSIRPRARGVLVPNHGFSQNFPPLFPHPTDSDPPPFRVTTTPGTDLASNPCHRHQEWLALASFLGESRAFQPIVCGRK